MSENRGDHTTTLLNDGTLFVSGGRAAKATNTTELLDTVTGQWTLKSPMSYKRYGHSQVLLNDGNVLVIGGSTNAMKDYIPEIYNPSTDTWTQIDNMQYPRRQGHTATVMGDGRVIVTGGIAEIKGTRKTIAHVEIYDPQNGSWSMTSDMSEPREMHKAILLNNNKVLVVGSKTDEQYILGSTSAELYDPETGEWSNTGNLSYPHATNFTATKLKDGSILVSGGGARGRYLAPNITEVMEIYDPSSNEWSLTEPMTQKSWEHTANLLDDGNILFVKSRILEIYNPETKTWTLIGEMSDSRAGDHTATLVNGKTFIIGGSNITYDKYGGVALRDGFNSVLVYDPSVEW